MQAPGTSSVEVRRVAPEHITFVWPQIEHLIEKNSRGLEDFITCEDLYDSLVKDHYTLWVGIDDGTIEALALTQFNGHNKRKPFYIVWVAGRSKKYMREALETFEAFAAVIGAKEIIAAGRFGLQKLLEGRGFKQERIELVKQLSFVADENNEVHWRQ